MSKVCDLCGKDFSGDPYWSTALKRHRGRKNPCNRQSDVKYVRESRGVKEPPRNSMRCLDSVEWAAPSSPPPGTPFRFVAPWFFKQIVKDPANVCFVRPNLSKNEIWVKMTKDEPVKIVNRDDFIRLFVNHVMLRLFPRIWDGYGAYVCDLIGDAGIDMDEPEWTELVYDKSEFMFGMRDVLRDVLDTWPNKTPLRNMLVNFV